MESFNEFCSNIRDEVRSCLPDNKDKISLDIEMIKKLNLTFTGLSASYPGRAYPVLNLEEYYRRYKAGESKELLVKEMAVIFNEGIDPDLEMERMGNIARASKWLFIRVNNAGNNTEYLQDIPHLLVNNLSLTCHILMSYTENGAANVLVTNDLLYFFGITEEKLFQIAMDNSPRLFPPSIEKIYNDKSNIWMVSNTNRAYGASALFYPGIMETIYEKMGGAYFVLPSSIHECILVPESLNCPVENMKRMVEEINKDETIISRSDILSNSVYYYDHDKRSLLEID